MQDFFPRFMGNAPIKRRLGQSLADRSLPHAVILSAPKGGGKHTLARQIAMATACEHRGEAGYPLPCGTCAACHKIREGNSPDVTLVHKEADKSEFGVSVVRDLRNEISVLPNDLDTKVYILENTELMNENAQNALLLTLEEPPAFVLFLLLCENTDALLPTIRSRAPIFRLQPLDENTLKSYLLSDLPPAATAGEARALYDSAPLEFTTVLRHSEGWAGKAETLLDPAKRTALVQSTSDAIALCRLAAERTATRDMLSLLLLPIKQSRADAENRLSFLMAALGELLLLQKSEERPLTFFPDKEEAVLLTARFTAERLLRMLTVTKEAQQALREGANVNLTMSHLFNRFTQTALQ